MKTKKCDIWVSQGNPCKITCHTCNKTFAELSMPIPTNILKSVCDVYEVRCNDAYEVRRKMTLEKLA